MSLGATTYHRVRPRERGRIPPGMRLLAACVVGITLVGAFGSTFVQVYRLEREASRLAQLQRDLEAQNAQLRAEIKALHTPEYVEKLAREQLGLVKPGEIAFLIVQTPADSAAGRPLPDSVTPALPLPRPGSWAWVWDALRRLLHRSAP